MGGGLLWAAVKAEEEEETAEGGGIKIEEGGMEGAWDGRMSNMYASAEGRGVLACIPRLPLFWGGGFVGFWEKRGDRRKKKEE